MKYNLINLLFLVLTVSVISSPGNEVLNINKDELLKNELTCLNAGKENMIKKNCNQKCTLQKQKNPEKKENGGGTHIESAGDYYLPGSPVSRYILLQ